MHKIRDFQKTSTNTGLNQTDQILLSRRTVALGGGLGLAAALHSSRSWAWDGPLMDVVEGSEEFVIASDAYIYGYPLVTMR